MKRKLIRKDESRISVLQIIGFVLIVVGVISIIIASFFQGGIVPSLISVTFFVTMLGFSLAFPSLLEDQNKGLSTMRITVFMITNVICMLLLKIGWAEGIKSLLDIHLDQWWMGVIAFVFGAKAVQSYFENRSYAGYNQDALPPIKTAGNDLATIQDPTKNEIIRKAIKQFSLKHLDGVVGVGKGFRTVNGNRESCVQINVNDERYLSIYDKPLEVALENGNTVSVLPKVVFVGTPKTHSGGPGAGIVNIGGSNGNGTLGCIVADSDTHARYILSCQHVLNHDFNYDDVSNPNAIAYTANPAVIIARHVSGMRTNEIDAGLAELTATVVISNSELGPIIGTRNLNDNDTDGTLRVFLRGYDEDVNDSVRREGIVVTNDFYAEFEYPSGESFGIDDLIVLSSGVNHAYTTISKPGYSGALVVDESKYAIGLLVGGDKNYSYAIPINKILTAFNCSLL